MLGIESNKRLLIGVTARQWLTKTAQFNYEKAVAESIEYLVSEYEAEVILIPQVTSEFHDDDDRVVNKRIYDYISDHNHVHTIDTKLDHYEIKSVYDSLDLVLGTRFHSVIFALTSYVPAIAIEYEHKTSGIMHDLNLDRWVIKIDEVNSKKLCKMIDDLIISHIDYKKQLKQVMPDYIKETDEPIKYVREAYEKFSETSLQADDKKTIFELQVAK